MHDLETILERLLEESEGAELAAVGGMDGLVVEQRPSPGVLASRTGEPPGGRSPDLAVCVAELTNALAGARRAVGEALEGGAIEAVQVRSERRLLMVRHVTPAHYLLLGLRLGANASAAELALESAAQQVRELVR